MDINIKYVERIYKLQQVICFWILVLLISAGLIAGSFIIAAMFINLNQTILSYVGSIVGAFVNLSIWLIFSLGICVLSNTISTYVRSHIKRDGL